MEPRIATRCGEPAHRNAKPRLRQSDCMERYNQLREAALATGERDWPAGGSIFLIGLGVIALFFTALG